MKFKSFELMICCSNGEDRYIDVTCKHLTERVVDAHVRALETKGLYADLILVKSAETEGFVFLEEVMECR